MVEEMTVDELAVSWINGNRSDVIDNLSKRHPAITALLLTMGNLSEEDKYDITYQLHNSKTDEELAG